VSEAAALVVVAALVFGVGIRVGIILGRRLDRAAERLLGSDRATVVEPQPPAPSPSETEGSEG